MLPDGMLIDTRCSVGKPGGGWNLGLNPPTESRNVLSLPDQQLRRAIDPCSGNRTNLEFVQHRIEAALVGTEVHRAEDVHVHLEEHGVRGSAGAR